MATPVIDQDPVQSAKDAGLRYVTDSQPGIRRKAVDGDFATWTEPLRDPEVLDFEPENIVLSRPIFIESRD